ncbi:rod-binding protein [Microvirga sp. 17 mud 1-3]|uniref:rod-binding protein n=1 Tax=Microvirga sp. 17 mud 1-3 TaxID=2082949 RepID=UPI000D6D38AE|nr:rod-binding protein [Microvirga sp. 17 mud 1-3]AWM85901.1 flagellar biosynthesis protein FlgJ [Microvirga sp. 17 mud 1-3]
MGIKPPSDIVLDVARAADPVKLQTASRKLMELSDSGGATEFAEVFNSMPHRGGTATKDPYAIQVISQNQTTLGSAAKPGSAYQQFEAFVLQSFIESMLPKDSEATFGKGTAGSVWRSMMAEQIGAQIARAGGIGIASKLLAGRAVSANENAVASPTVAGHASESET